MEKSEVRTLFQINQATPHAIGNLGMSTYSSVWLARQ